MRNFSSILGPAVQLRIAPPVTDVEVSLSASPNPVLEGQSVGVTAKQASPLPAGERRDLRIPVLILWGSEYNGSSVVTYGTADQGDLYSLGSVLSQTTDGSGNAHIAWWLPTTITIGSGAHQRIDGINNMRTNQDGDSDDDTFTVELDATHPDWPEGIVAGSPDSVLITITDDDRSDGPPSTPTDPRFTEGDGRLDFTWKAGPRAGAPAPPTRYDVQYTLDPLGTDAVWTSVDHSGTETSASITELENGRLVWVRVRAANTAGQSAWVEGTGRPTEPEEVEDSGPALSGVGICWDSSASGSFSQCGPGRITSYGYRHPALFGADGADATHVKVTPHAAAGATVRVGRVTWPNGVETVAWAAVASGSQSGAIALDTETIDTVIYVEVTESSGSVTRYTVIIQKPVGGL